MEFLGHKADVYLILKEMAKQFSRVTVQFYSPPSVLERSSSSHLTLVGGVGGL